MWVVSESLRLQKKLQCYNNVGSPTALKDRGGIHMSKNSLSHTNLRFKLYIFVGFIGIIHYVYLRKK